MQPTYKAKTSSEGRIAEHRLRARWFGSASIVPHYHTSKEIAKENRPERLPLPETILAKWCTHSK